MKLARTAIVVAFASLTLAGCAVYEPYPVASAPVVVAPAPVVGVYGGWGWGGHRGWGYRHYR